jgi:transcriptional regulator with XRE-family HTH domain
MVSISVSCRRTGGGLDGRSAGTGVAVWSVMDGQPQDIIRTIRERLGMSRAEFARALGWASSTVARWESGKAQPSRLALKIILAFAEERGVRWRPQRELVPVVAAPVPPPTTLPSIDVRPLSVRPMPDANPPRWQAELRFRVAVDGRSAPPAQRWIGNAAIGAALCVIALLGAPMLTPGASSSPAPSPVFARAVHPQKPAPEPAPPAAAPMIEETPAPVAVAAPEPAPPPITEAPVMARLEGVTLLGTVRRATFRTDEDALTILEGEQLGARQAVRIAGHGVELTDASGHVQIVRLGESIPIE